MVAVGDKAAREPGLGSPLAGLEFWLPLLGLPVAQHAPPVSEHTSHRDMCGQHVLVVVIIKCRVLGSCFHKKSLWFIRINSDTVPSKLSSWLRFLSRIPSTPDRDSSKSCYFTLFPWPSADASFSLSQSLI